MSRYEIQSKNYIAELYKVIYYVLDEEIVGFH